METAINETPSEVVNYKADPKRWLILAGLILLSGFNNITVAMFAPIIESVQEAYMLPNPMLVSMNAIVWSI